jgi:hypothetical protein
MIIIDILLIIATFLLWRGYKIQRRREELGFTKDYKDIASRIDISD